MCFFKKGLCVCKGGAEFRPCSFERTAAGRGNEFTDKTSGMLYACLAYSELMDGNAVGAEKALIQAKLTAERFDANPNYSAAAIRFVSCDESASAYDDIGATAAEGVRNTVSSL